MFIREVKNGQVTPHCKGSTIISSSSLLCCVESPKPHAASMLSRVTNLCCIFSPWSPSYSPVSHIFFSIFHLLLGVFFHMVVYGLWSSWVSRLSIYTGWKMDLAWQKCGS
ncbi:hypothetical protein RGQ29_031152 [Quercus rubra]|uniref:Uncharacterized protein n=1 Tax=Quercus rubra TaxID=3512 RepID=A0AAN7IID6_QUERU|nr:hypothetical protein RGQ29_031152 [Quercus rubra]